MHPPTVRLNDDGLPERQYSNIMYLPPELLSQIFIHCESQSWTGHLPVISTEEAPLKLGRVCRRWREISLTSPRLWTAFSVPESLLLDEDVVWNATLHGIRTWLERSGSCPLSFQLNYASREYSRFQQLFDLFVPHFKRWDSVMGDFPLTCVRTIFACIAQGTPVLKTLQIFVRWTTSPSQALNLDVSDSPLLECIDLDGVNCQFSFGDTIFHNLKELRVTEGFSAETFMLSLRHCPLLSESNVYLRDGNELLLRSSNEVVDHNSLRDLHIFTADRDIDVGPLLDHLHLPGLVNLLISTRSHPNTRYWPHLHSLLTRSRPPLTRLVLASVQMKEIDLLKCLEETPQLTLLIIDELEVTDSLVSALTPKFQSTGELDYLCPKLEKLILWLPNCHDITYDAIRMLVLTRWLTPENFTPAARSVLAQRGVGFEPQKLRRMVLRLHGFNTIRFREDCDISECIKEGLELVM